MEDRTKVRPIILSSARTVHSSSQQIAYVVLDFPTES